MLNVSNEKLSRLPVADVVGNERIRSSTCDVEKVRRVTSATNLNTITRRDTSHAELVSDVDVAMDAMRNDTTGNYVQEENCETVDFGFDRLTFGDIEDDKNGDHHPVNLLLCK